MSRKRPFWPVQVLLGALLVCAALGLTWSNERRTAQRLRALEESGALFVPAGADVVDPANEGRLVVVRGRLTVPERLVDPETGFSTQSLAMERRVQVLLPAASSNRADADDTVPGHDAPDEANPDRSQRTPEETDPGADGSPSPPTPNGPQAESSNSAPNDASAESIEAPRPATPWRSLRDVRWEARSVHIGAFTLPPALVSRLTTVRDRPLKQHELDELAPRLGRTSRTINGSILIEPDPETEPRTAPTLITYRTAPAGTLISVRAMQVGDTFAPYRTPSGRFIFQVTREVIEKPDPARARWHGIGIAWWLRIAGLAGVLLGLRAIADADRTPGGAPRVLARIAKEAFGPATLLLGVGLTLLAAALPWLPYRPWVTLILSILGGTALALWALVRPDRSHAAESRGREDSRSVRLQAAE